MLMSPEEETLAFSNNNECYCIPDFGSLSLNALYLVNRGYPYRESASKILGRLMNEFGAPGSLIAEKKEAAENTKTEFFITTSGGPQK